MQYNGTYFPFSQNKSLLENVWRRGHKGSWESGKADWVYYWRVQVRFLVAGFLFLAFLLVLAPFSQSWKIIFLQKRQNKYKANQVQEKNNKTEKWQEKQSEIRFFNSLSKSKPFYWESFAKSDSQQDKLSCVSIQTWIYDLLNAKFKKLGKHDITMFRP